MVIPPPQPPRDPRIFALFLGWSLLTFIVAIVCCACCILPFWIAGSVVHAPRKGDAINYASHLGLFRRCGYPLYRSNGDVEWFQECGYYPSLEGIPHWVWRLVLILLILAACLLLFLACFVICAGACTSLLLKNASLSRVCSYAYLLAGGLCLVGCIAYPFGWSNNAEFTQICGHESGIFRLGRCEIGWAYVLAVAGGVISVVLAGIPNIIQSLVQRNSQMQMQAAEAKHSMHVPVTHNGYAHLASSWTSFEPPPSTTLLRNGVVLRRRPHSLALTPELGFPAWDLNPRLSCSVFGPIPEQQPTSQNVDTLQSISPTSIELSDSQ